jgi:hypothetical protein
MEVIKDIIIKIAGFKIKHNELIYVEFNDGNIITDNIISKIRYIKKNINNIKKIVVITTSSSMLSYTAIIKNNKLHNVESFSLYLSEIDENTKKPIIGNFYFIDGIELLYDNWINHPVKVRFERSNKLESL